MTSNIHWPKIQSRFSNYIFLFLILCASSCVPPTDRTSTDVAMDFSNTTIVKILDLQDRGEVDSLYPYLKDKNPTIRFNAVKAFASIKDSSTVDTIISMLKDPVLEIRTAAAYVLGQLGDGKAETPLIAAFTSKDTLSVNNIFNQQILEALGKCGTKSTLKNIASVATYRPSDNLLLLGQVRSFYRFGQRGIFDEAATNAVVSYIANRTYPDDVRINAAHYLSRFKDANISNHLESISKSFESSDNPYIKMALANALGRTGNTNTAKLLISTFNFEKDYRVKSNIMRAMSNFEFDSVKTFVLENVKNSNIHVADIAAEVIGKKGVKEELLNYKALITSDLNWKVKATLYGSIIKASPLIYTKFKNEVVAEILPLIDASTNNYERAELIKAIGQDPYQYITLANLKSKLKSEVEKSSWIDALGAILSNPNFVYAYKSKSGEVRTTIFSMMTDACKTGNAGMVAASCNYIKNSNLFGKESIFDSTWFEETKNKLKLPRDIEAYNELMAANAYLTDTTFKAPKPKYTHPINFNLLKENGDSVKLVMKTSKGNINMILFSKRAPGAVANFIELCQKDFYDGKIFHRVVPNFVIQAGCPRGDGYGALDYTIRSEIFENYYNDEGYLGMAHAGNHTEGTQFFITHSPTPHLDGNYSIFGKVTEGMDIVHAIQVGDKIIDVIILK